MTDWKRVAEKPVFLGGHRKSGTTMLLALLDGHEELGVFPADSGFFYAYYPVYDTDTFSVPEKKTRIKEFAFKNVRNEYENRIDPAKRTPFSFDTMEKDFEAEADSGSGTAKEILLAMAGSYVRQSPLCRGALKHWVEKTTSTEIYADAAFRWFPEARFIHVIRDPRDNFGSMKSGWKKRYQNQTESIEWLLQSLLDRGKLGMELARVNEKIFGPERYKVIRFEDLVADPEKMMRDIAKFLGIKFTPSLLVPTFFGSLWKGNNFEGKTFSSVSNQNAGRWQERISEKEARIIEFYFKDLMREFDYKPAFSLKDAADAARDHYRWFNYAQRFSIDLKTAAVPS